jgi:hypothetical protein
MTVHAYKIDPVNRVYLPVGIFTDVIETAEPWPIEIPISSLTPRHIR